MPKKPEYTTEQSGRACDSIIIIISIIVSILSRLRGDTFPDSNWIVKIESDWMDDNKKANARLCDLFSVHATGYGPHQFHSFNAIFVVRISCICCCRCCRHWCGCCLQRPRQQQWQVKWYLGIWTNLVVARLVFPPELPSSMREKIK